MARSYNVPLLTSVFKIFDRKPKLYDLVAASPLILWCMLGVSLQWNMFVHDIGLLPSLRVEFLGLLDLVSRFLRITLAVLLGTLIVLRRPAVKKYGGVLPRIVSFIGAYGGVAAQVLPVNPDLNSWIIVSSALIVFGTSFAIFSLAWLGRSISIFPESRKLVTSGPYSVVRHPLYLGEQTAILGIALQSGSPLVIAILAVQMGCLFSRMKFEESVLTDTFPEYAEYRKRTALIIPGIW